MLVGAVRYSFAVANCPATYYKADGKCMQCPLHVNCLAGSTISEWQLDEGYWRAGSEYTEVLACRFGAVSCPGVGLNQERGRDAYCGSAFVGPLCSHCAADHFLSWTGNGDCHRCAAGKSHWPTIGLVSSVLVLCGMLASCVSKKCQHRNTGAPPSAFFVEAEKLYILAEVKFFTLFLAIQVFAACLCRPLSTFVDLCRACALLLVTGGMRLSTIH